MFVLLIVVFIDKVNVVLLGKLLGRVRFCKYVEVKIEGLLLNLILIFFNLKLSRYGVFVVKIRKYFCFSFLKKFK